MGNEVCVFVCAYLQSQCCIQLQLCLSFSTCASIHVCVCVCVCACVRVCYLGYTWFLHRNQAG